MYKTSRYTLRLQNIQEIIQNIRNKIVVIWMSSHVGIKEAKIWTLPQLTVEHRHLFLMEIINQIKSKIEQMWTEEWQEENKLRQIKDNTST